MRESQGRCLGFRGSSGGRLGLLEERSWTAASNAIGLFSQLQQKLASTASPSESFRTEVAFNIVQHSMRDAVLDVSLGCTVIYKRIFRLGLLRQAGLLNLP